MSDIVRQLKRYCKILVSKGGGNYDGTEWDGLKISFDIEKTRESGANTAKIQIYNMRQESWTLFETEKDLFVVLFVAYDDRKNYEILYTGNISKAKTTLETPNIITVLECGDGQKALKYATLDKSYKAKTIIKEAMKDAVQTFKDVGNVAIEEVGDFISGKTNFGFSLSGTSKDIVDEMARKYNFDWSIQNNKCVIKPKDETTNNTAIDLNKRTGLVGTPIRTEKGIELTCLINPKIIPKKKIYVYSEGLDNTDAFFQVTTVKIKGDTHGNDWLMMVEGTRLNV